MYQMNTRSAFLAGAIIACGLLAAVPAAAGSKVVAHPGVPAAAIASGDLQQIFLGKQASWSDGTAIELGVLAGGATAEEFLKTYVKKTPSQFGTFWKKAVFSGTGTAPREFAGPDELAAWVAATPGAVGFVDEAAAAAGCKVLAIE